MPADILLRAVTPADLPILFAQQLDPDAARMAAFPPRDREAFMAHLDGILRDASITKQTILSSGQVAGYIVCFVQAGMPLVGYWLGKPYWGKGVATRALSAFLGRVGTRPLYARVAKHNLASIRVLEKCGFVVVGEEPLSQDDALEELVMMLTP